MKITIVEKLIAMMVVIALVLLFTAQSLYSWGNTRGGNFFLLFFCIYAGVSLLAIIAHLIDSRK
jgi:hypothetical protein